MKKIIQLSVMLLPACHVYFSKKGNSIVKSIKFLSLYYLFSYKEFLNFFVMFIKTMHKLIVCFLLEIKRSQMNWLFACLKCLL